VSTSDFAPTTASRFWTGCVLGGLGGFLTRDLDLPTIVSFWGDRTPLVLVAALLGGLLWLTRLRRVVAAAVACIGLFWSIVAFTPLTRHLVDGLVRRDPVEAADAIFVLSSDLQPDGDLNPTSMSRLVHGLELIGQAKASRLVLSELHPPKRSYAKAARQLMDNLGLDPELLVVQPVSNTRDEAVAVGRLYRERGWSRLLVVTSPLHSRRACAALEREGVKVISSPCPESRYDLEYLARAESRLQAFGGVLHERVGLWVYARRGWVAASR